MNHSRCLFGVAVGVLIAASSVNAQSSAPSAQPDSPAAPETGIKATTQGAVVPRMPLAMPPRQLSGIVPVQVNVLKSDVVALGKVEEAGGVEDLDFVMPYEVASSRHAVQRLKIGISRVYRDTVNGIPAQTNTVADALAFHPGGTNRAVLAYAKNQSGVFMMQRIPNRMEFLVTKWEPMISASRVAMTADADRLSWGAVSNGLQIAVLSPWPTMAAGDMVTLSLLAAVRNVSTGPILLNAFGGDRPLTCLVDGNATQAVVTPPAVALGKDFGDGHVIVLQPNQIAFVAPDGGVGESGFRVKVAASDAWGAQVVYASGREAKVGDRTLWVGRLESKPIEVKRMMRPPIYSGPRRATGGSRGGSVEPSVGPVPQRPAPHSPKPAPAPAVESKAL